MRCLGVGRANSNQKLLLRHYILIFSISVSVKLKRITITATTPSNSAVRFETGTSELVLSNRIANVQASLILFFPLKDENLLKLVQCRFLTLTIFKLPRPNFMIRTDKRVFQLYMIFYFYENVEY